MGDVLVVEDDHLIAELLQTALEADGYRVTGVAPGVTEAMALAERTDPDFAIVDVNLARGESGTEVGRRLRREGVAVLFSTGNDRDHGLTAHDGDAVMLKPYRMSDVGHSLTIIRELTRTGRTDLTFPRGFHLLASPNPVRDGSELR